MTDLELKPRVIKALPVPTILEVPHLNRIIQFAYPLEKNRNGWDRPATDSNEVIASNILKRVVFTYDGGIPNERKLRLPTSEETISLLYALYADERTQEISEFRSIACLRNHYFYETSLWTPDGVYLVSNCGCTQYAPEIWHREPPKISSGVSTTNLENILKQTPTTEVNGVLISKDKKVAFAPKSTYHCGLHTPKTLKEDGLIIALARGITGAEKLAIIAEKFLSLEKRHIEIKDALLQVSQSPQLKGYYGDCYPTGINLCLSQDTHGEDYISNKDKCFIIETEFSGFGISLGVLI